MGTMPDYQVLTFVSDPEEDRREEIRKMVYPTFNSLETAVRANPYLRLDEAHPNVLPFLLSAIQNGEFNVVETVANLGWILWNDNEIAAAVEHGLPFMIPILRSLLLVQKDDGTNSIRQEILSAVMKSPQACEFLIWMRDAGWKLPTKDSIDWSGDINVFEYVLLSATPEMLRILLSRTGSAAGFGKRWWKEGYCPEFGEFFYFEKLISDPDSYVETIMGKIDQAGLTGYQTDIDTGINRLVVVASYYQTRDANEFARFRGLLAVYVEMMNPHYELEKEAVENMYTLAASILEDPTFP